MVNSRWIETNCSILRGACSFAFLCLELIIWLVYIRLVSGSSSNGRIFFFSHYFCNALMLVWLSLSYFMICRCRTCASLCDWSGLFKGFKCSLGWLWIFVAASRGRCVDAHIRSSMLRCGCLNCIAHGGSYNRRYNRGLTATILWDVCAARRYRIGTSSVHECRVCHLIEILCLKGSHASLKLICPRCLGRWRTKRLWTSKAHILWQRHGCHVTKFAHKWLLLMMLHIFAAVHHLILHKIGI